MTSLRYYLPTESHTGKAHKPTSLSNHIPRRCFPRLSTAVPLPFLFKRCIQIPLKSWPVSNTLLRPAAASAQPKIPVPPPSTSRPSKPTDVVEDFSEAQWPFQNLVSTLCTSIEPDFRLIRGDLGSLEYTGDEVEPYIMPQLEQHYSESEQWED